MINNLYQREVLLSSFHLKGHTLEFHPQTQKLEPSPAAAAPQENTAPSCTPVQHEYTVR